MELEIVQKSLPPSGDTEPFVDGTEPYTNNKRAYSTKKLQTHECLESGDISNSNTISNKNIKELNQEEVPLTACGSQRVQEDNNNQNKESAACLRREKIRYCICLGSVILFTGICIGTGIGIGVRISNNLTYYTHKGMETDILNINNVSNYPIIDLEIDFDRIKSENRLILIPWKSPGNRLVILDITRQYINITEDGVYKFDLSVNILNSTKDKDPSVTDIASVCIRNSGSKDRCAMITLNTQRSASVKALLDLKRRDLVWVTLSGFASVYHNQAFSHMLIEKYDSS